MKTSFTGIVFVLLAIASITLLLLYQQKAIKNLEPKIQSISLTKIALTSATVKVNLAIYNPNIFRTKIGEFDANFYANGQMLSGLNSNETIIIPAKETANESFEIAINYFDVGLALASAIKSGKVRWTINGTYRADYWIGAYPYRFEITR